MDIFSELYGLSGHNIVLDTLIRFGASYLQYVLIAALVIATTWPVRRFRMAIAATIAGGIARFILKPIILLFIHRPRPYVAWDSIHTLIRPEVGAEYQAFPSGHALFYFALAAAIFAYDRKLGWWFFAGATFMGIARVAAGVHWPTDIVGGAALGILTGYVVTHSIAILRPE